MLVQVHPSERAALPLSSAAVLDRVNEITFHGSLIKELRSLAILRKLIQAEGLDVSGGRTLRVPRAVGVLAERIDELLQARGRYSQIVHVLGELKDTIACDIDRAQTELGYAPATTLLQGMRESIRWCVERGLVL